MAADSSNHDFKELEKDDEEEEYVEEFIEENKVEEVIETDIEMAPVTMADVKHLGKELQLRLQRANVPATGLHLLGIGERPSLRDIKLVFKTKLGFPEDTALMLARFISEPKKSADAKVVFDEDLEVDEKQIES